MLKVSRHLDRYAGRVNMQDGIAHIRKLKDYLKYFSFKDIISQSTKPPKKRSFTTNSDRYTDLLLPIWTTREAQAGNGAAATAATKITPKQYPMDNIQLVAPPVGMNMTQIVWNAAHRIYNLRELVVLMINSGAAFGDIIRTRLFPLLLLAFWFPSNLVKLYLFLQPGRSAIFDGTCGPLHAWRGPHYTGIIPSSRATRRSHCWRNRNRRRDEKLVLPTKLVPSRHLWLPSRKLKLTP